MWDRRKKVTESLEAKKLSYPGLLFSVTNMETGADLTPSFKNIHTLQPLFSCSKDWGPTCWLPKSIGNAENARPMYTSYFELNIIETKYNY